MNELYRIAIDPTLPLEARYGAMQAMLAKKKYQGKQLQKNLRQRKYNHNRKDYRFYPKTIA